ncbi:MAG: hypothetical protein IPL49_08260 [Saprospirales bacterium]|nr:hypothetical protein [Saprospirales bacterium]
MAEKTFLLLPSGLLDEYRAQVAPAHLNRFRQLEESELSIDTFSFYTSVSAVFSSRIEGEEIELDSYVKHKRFGMEFLPDYTRKTDDLYNAYQFAKSARCTGENIASAHRMLTAHFLPVHRQGKLQTGNMYVTKPDGKIEYVAAWLMQSEKNYYLRHRDYYQHIRLLGLEYDLLDYSNALPFLLMLPQALILNDA